MFESENQLKNAHLSPLLKKTSNYYAVNSYMNVKGRKILKPIKQQSTVDGFLNSSHTQVGRLPLAFPNVSPEEGLINLAYTQNHLRKSFPPTMPNKKLSVLVPKFNRPTSQNSSTTSRPPRSLRERSPDQSKIPSRKSKSSDKSPLKRLRSKDANEFKVSKVCKTRHSSEEANERKVRKTRSLSAVLICPLCKAASEICTCKTTRPYVCESRPEELVSSTRKLHDVSLPKDAGSTGSKKLYNSKHESGSLVTKKSKSYTVNNYKYGAWNSSLQEKESCGKTVKRLHRTERDSKHYSKSLRKSTSPREEMRLKKRRSVNTESLAHHSYSTINVKETGSPTRENNNCCSGEQSATVVVVDTNVLLSDIGLEAVKTLRHKMFFGKNMKVIVPFVVLLELDNLKSDARRQDSAQKGIRWCHTYFENKDPCIEGQNYEDYQKTIAKYGNKNADDLILSCCLSYQECCKVYLLTNDINLQNKAIVSKVNTLSAEKLNALMTTNLNRGINTSHKEYGGNCFLENSCLDTVSKTGYEMMPDQSDYLSENSNMPVFNMVETGPDTFDDSSDLLRNSSTLLHNNESVVPCDAADIDNTIVKCLGDVLEYAMKDAYGDKLWKDIILYKPPWSALQVLKCYEKHWIAVFIDKFPNQMKDLISELRSSQESEITSNLSDRLLKCILYLIEKSPYKELVKDIEIQPISSQSATEADGNATDTSNIKGAVLDIGTHSCSILNVSSEKLKSFAMSGMEKENENCSEIKNGLKLLRSTLISFGFLLIDLKDEKNMPASPTATLKEHIGKFWNLAQRNAPCVIGDTADVKSFSCSLEGKNFLGLCVNEFEKLIREIESVIPSEIFPTKY